MSSEKSDTNSEECNMKQCGGGGAYLVECNLCKENIMDDFNDDGFNEDFFTYNPCKCKLTAEILRKRQKYASRYQ